mmetsp:Transcript_5291/g.12083  ORF Transcript_5291/g.12083 Transcript_5291/m.12083 type:complete len:93 (+) Transcript_5291:200-478(+)
MQSSRHLSSVAWQAFPLRLVADFVFVRCLCLVVVACHRPAGESDEDEATVLVVPRIPVRVRPGAFDVYLRSLPFHLSFRVAGDFPDDVYTQN